MVDDSQLPKGQLSWTTLPEHEKDLYKKRTVEMRKVSVAKKKEFLKRFDITLEELEMTMDISKRYQNLRKNRSQRLSVETKYRKSKELLIDPEI